jgi:hypothetical protein
MRSSLGGTVTARRIAALLVVGGVLAAAAVWLGLVGLAVVAGIGAVVIVLARISARPTWRARYDTRRPFEHGERGLAIRGYLPPLTVGRRPRKPKE